MTHDTQLSNGNGQPAGPGGRLHEPSAARDLVRQARRALRTPELAKVIDQAQRLRDPYYSAHALAGIAYEMATGGMDGPQFVFLTAFDYVAKVDQQWRRAEVLGIVAGKMSRTQCKDFARAVEILKGFTEEKPRYDAFKAIVREMSRAAAPDIFYLIEVCKDERERMDVLKDIIRIELKSKRKDMPKIDKALKSLKDPYFRAKAYNYVAFAFTIGKEPEGPAYFQESLKMTLMVPDEDKRLDLLKYLADNQTAAGNFALDGITGGAQSFMDPAKKASLLGHLAGRQSKYRQPAANDTFDKALTACEAITDPKAKSNALRNIAMGLSRAKSPKAEEVFENAKRIAESVAGPEGETLRERIKMDKEGAKDGGSKASAQIEAPLPHVARKPGEKAPVLGLFNTYEKVLGPAHIRAIARAAPLCWAYDLDLAAIGFPLKDEKEALDKAKTDTTVGKDGKYLEELFRSERFIIATDTGVHDLGALVATTSHPDPKKKAIISDILAKEKRACFILGVGRLGLPRSVMEKAKYHVEFTGKNVSLETATAMGILAHLLGDASKRQDAKKS